MNWLRKKMRIWLQVNRGDAELTGAVTYTQDRLRKLEERIGKLESAMPSPDERWYE